MELSLGLLALFLNVVVVMPKLGSEPNRSEWPENRTEVKSKVWQARLKQEGQLFT